MNMMSYEKTNMIIGCVGRGVSSRAREVMAHTISKAEGGTEKEA